MKREMIMWAVIFLVLFAALFAGMYFLVTRFGRFNVIAQLAGDKKWLKNLIGFAIVLVIAGVFFAVFDITNAIVVVIHMCLFWLLAELAAKLIKHPYTPGRTYWVGIIAIVLTAVYLCIGAYKAHVVTPTFYTIETEKDLGIGDGTLRIAMISDSHVRKSFNQDWMEKNMLAINEQKPDIVVVVGDFVDDDTRRPEMEGSCAALGKLTPTIGTYFVFGNHDRGYYGSNHRGFTAAELCAELEKCGVKILVDEYADLKGNIRLLGREDKSVSGRKAIGELMAEAGEGAYVITLDHQPVDYAAEAAAKCDMVLSGHTHGGNMWPIGWMIDAFKLDDKNYGHEKREDTDFIVSSGIGCWSLQFKTGCKSEYVIVDIKQK